MTFTIRHRDYTWDVMKLFLIMLVILGHWLEYGLNNSINRVVFNFIYLFHMPLFIFISGYFSRKKDRQTFRADILRLIETYVVAQVLYVITSFILQGRALDWHQLYIPNAAAWYLLSLILWRVVLQYIPERLLKRMWLLSFTVTVSLLAGFLPVGNELSLQRTLAFLPFFMCGYLLKGKIQFQESTREVAALCYATMGAALIASFLLLNRDVSFIIWCNSNYYSTPSCPEWLLMALRGSFLMVASIMMYCIIQAFPFVSKPSLLSRMGTETLFYYVYHIVVIRLGIIIIRYFHLPQSFPVMILYALFTLVILSLLNKVKLFRLALNPVSSLIRLLPKYS